MRLRLDERGDCKPTLEMLEGNHSAIKLYELVYFSEYQFDWAVGQANSFQKWLK